VPLLADGGELDGVLVVLDVMLASRFLASFADRLWGASVAPTRPTGFSPPETRQLHMGTSSDHGAGVSTRSTVF